MQAVLRLPNLTCGFEGQRRPAGVSMHGDDMLDSLTPG